MVAHCGSCIGPFDFERYERIPDAPPADERVCELCEAWQHRPITYGQREWMRRQSKRGKVVYRLPKPSV